jgi:hypothetical protein
VLYFVRAWANPNAKVITPGKRSVDLGKQLAETPAYVYFILNRDNQAIKIGFAKDVKKRLDTLQTSSPNLRCTQSIRPKSRKIR